MCQYLKKLIRLLVGVVTPILLLSCASQTAYHSHSVHEYTKLVQTISIIKKNIQGNSLYQKEPYRTEANQYSVYLDSLLERVNNRVITVNDAQALVSESYVQFKAGKFHLKHNQMLYEEPAPAKNRSVPDKPGAL